MKLIIDTVFIALLVYSTCGCEEASDAESGRHHERYHDAEKDVSGVQSLSPELRGLLSKEMLALQDGMTSIIPLYIAGQWGEIADIAGKMKNSYILKQNLTKTQMHELHTSLSDAFLKSDQQFHYLSGMLSNAAEMKKPELVGFYFSKLSESCVSCHSQFATHKFPAFASQGMSKKHHH